MNLYPYQREGVRFLASRKRAYLADTMGLGKSAQAIVAARAALSDNPAGTFDKGTPPNVVIVCPASAVPNWQAEWDKWDGPGQPRIVSYSSLIRRDWKKWKPDVVILDEAHYAKSVSAKRTRAALGLARASNFAWLLSGTPMPNSPVELWAPMKYLFPEVIADLGITRGTQWRDRFCKCRPTPFGPKPYGVRNGAQLREILSGLMLRRTLDDVGLDLPPLRVDLVTLPKMPMPEYDGEAEREESMYASMRRHLGAAKAPAVARQIIEELDNNAYKKIVVLYHHRDVGAVLRAAFDAAGYSTLGFDGSTTQEGRRQAITEFQTDPRDRVFLAQQTSAGIAINLTAASELVLVEPAWTPADNQQAIKRVHRIGSTDPVRARVFAVEGTMDESIMKTITQKVQMLREVGLK